MDVAHQWVNRTLYTYFLLPLNNRVSIANRRLKAPGLPNTGVCKQCAVQHSACSALHQEQGYIYLQLRFREVLVTGLAGRGGAVPGNHVLRGVLAQSGGSAGGASRTGFAASIHGDWRGRPREGSRPRKSSRGVKTLLTMIKYEIEFRRIFHAFRK